MSLLKDRDEKYVVIRYLGGVKMKYQKPEIELMLLDAEDIVRTSPLTGEGGGDGDGYGDGNGGGGTPLPWE